MRAGPFEGKVQENFRNQRNSIIGSKGEARINKETKDVFNIGLE